jgi:hypothetical protein
MIQRDAVAPNGLKTYTMGAVVVTLSEKGTADVTLG